METFLVNDLDLWFMQGGGDLFEQLISNSQVTKLIPIGIQEI